MAMDDIRKKFMPLSNAMNLNSGAMLNDPRFLNAFQIAKQGASDRASLDKQLGQDKLRMGAGAAMQIGSPAIGLFNPMAGGATFGAGHAMMAGKPGMDIAKDAAIGAGTAGLISKMPTVANFVKGGGQPVSKLPSSGIQNVGSNVGNAMDDLIQRNVQAPVNNATKFAPGEQEAIMKNMINQEYGNARNIPTPQAQQEAFQSTRNFGQDFIQGKGTFAEPPTMTQPINNSITDITQPVVQNPIQQGVTGMAQDIAPMQQAVQANPIQEMVTSGGNAVQPFEGGGFNAPQLADDFLGGLNLNQGFGGGEMSAPMGSLGQMGNVMDDFAGASFNMPQAGGLESTGAMSQQFLNGGMGW